MGRALDSILKSNTFYGHSLRWADALDSIVQEAKLLADAGLSADSLGRLQADLERISSNLTIPEATLARAFVELSALGLHCESESAARD